MKAFFKSYVRETFKAIAENRRDSLNKRIIELKKELERAYNERDELDDKMGYA